MKHKLTAAAFGAALSTAGRPMPAAAPAVDARPRVVVVDRWNGSRFVEMRLVWNGAQYAPLD